MLNYQKYKKKKSKLFKPVRRLFQNILVIIFNFLTQLFPIRLNQWIGIIIGRIANRYIQSEKEYAKLNLKFCFPHLSEERINTIFRKNLENVGQTLFEVFCIKKIRKYPNKIIQFENIEHLKNDLTEKSVILLFAHYGNWELISLIPELYQIPSIAIASPLDNKFLNKVLIQKRENQMMDIIEKNQTDTGKRLVQAMKNKKMLIFGIDLDSDIQSIFVDFFGRKAKTPAGPAKIAIKSGLPVYFAIGERNSQGKHHIKVSLVSSPPYQKNSESEIYNQTRLYSQFLETKIKENPEQWIWFNRRWKSQKSEN